MDRLSGFKLFKIIGKKFRSPAKHPDFFELIRKNRQKIRAISNHPETISGFIMF